MPDTDQPQPLRVLSDPAQCMGDSLLMIVDRTDVGRSGLQFHGRVGCNGLERGTRTDPGYLTAQDRMKRLAALPDPKHGELETRRPGIQDQHPVVQNAPPLSTCVSTRSSRQLNR